LWTYTDGRTFLPGLLGHLDLKTALSRRRTDRVNAPKRARLRCCRRTLITSGFVDDVMFTHGGLRRRDAAAAASLQCRVRPNTPPARCCLHSVLGAKTRRVLCAGAECVMYRCLVFHRRSSIVGRGGGCFQQSLCLSVVPYLYEVEGARPRGRAKKTWRRL